MSTPQEVKRTLKELGVKPKRSLGQNFLVCESVAERTAQSVNPQNKVLEIGPGLGFLTQFLIKEAEVTAIEKDDVLAQHLRQTLDIDVVTADILETEVPSGQYSVVANLPFNISKKVIMKFLESNNPPQEMIVMVQKEVAESMVSQPPKMDLLGVIIQFLAPVETLFKVPRSCFWPQPKIDGTMIRIGQVIDRDNRQEFFKIVKRGFRHRRKMLSNNLDDKRKTERILKDIGLSPKARAESLSVEQWIELVLLYSN